MKFLRFIVLIVFIHVIQGGFLAASEPILKPWIENSWYWSYRGEPKLLLGASDDDNLFQWPPEQLIPHLDRLAKAGGNLIRNTMSDRPDKGFEIYPFKQIANGKFDLNQWNDAYWIRFERLLNETAKRDIIVQIEIWDRFDFTDNGGKNYWQRHPYNPKNNINYTYEQSTFAENYPDHPGANKQIFFYTTPVQRNIQIVLQYQQRFVEKMLSYSLQYEHVLYCMDNETRAEAEWGKYWAQFIKERAAKLNKIIYVTEMWDDWDLTAARHKQTFDHPEIYDFVDVSQNNHNKGQQHWDNFLKVREYLAQKPRPINTIKTYGADGNKFGHTDQDGIERFWRHLLAGAAALRFHRPPSGLGLSDKAVATIRATRKLESKIPIWSLKPANELLSEHELNAAYLAADIGYAYVLYLPAGNMVKVDLTAVKKQLNVQWIDIDSGEWGQQYIISGGTHTYFEAPDKRNWVAAIFIHD